MKKKTIIVIVVIIFIAILGGFVFIQNLPVSDEEKIMQQLKTLETMYTDEYEDSYIETLDNISEEKKANLEVITGQYFITKEYGWLLSVDCDKYKDCKKIKESLNDSLKKITSKANESLQVEYGEIKQDNTLYSLDIKVKGMNLRGLMLDVQNMINFVLVDTLSEDEILNSDDATFFHEVAIAKEKVVKYLVENKLDTYMTNDVKETLVLEKKKDTFTIPTISSYYGILFGNFDSHFEAQFKGDETTEEMENTYNEYDAKNLDRAYSYFQEMKEKGILK